MNVPRALEKILGFTLRIWCNSRYSYFWQSFRKWLCNKCCDWKKDVMENAQRSFLSSTFWTRKNRTSSRISNFRRNGKSKSWKIINNNGLKIMELWNKLSKTHNIKIRISGLPALSSFSFESKNSQNIKRLLLKKC